MRAVKRARAQGRCVCGWLVTYAVYSSPVGRTSPYYLASCYLASRLVRFSVRGRAAVGLQGLLYAYGDARGDCR